MADLGYPIVGVPVTRAERYPHFIGAQTDPDGSIEPVEVTQLSVDASLLEYGRVTLSAIADPNDAWGIELDLEVSDARELAQRLLDAATDIDGSPPE